MRRPVQWLLVTLAGVCVPVIASAQDTSVVYLHGLGSDSSGWVGAATRLQERTQSVAHLPELPWRQPYNTQAADLQSRPGYGALPHTSIAVGHSNGGIVAREWSRMRPLRAVVTIGTPHRGAPLLPHFWQWAGFHSSSGSILTQVGWAFAQWSDWAWVFAYAANALSWASDFSLWSVFGLAATLGIDASLPVAGDMHPHSPFLHSLNDSSNLSREAGALPGRVGIVSIAHNYYWAGPARAVAPDHADAIAVALYGAAHGLNYWGAHILSSADPTDSAASHQAFSLMGLAGYLLTIDPYYCALLSSVDVSACYANDGIVPYTSQEYPGAPNLYLGSQNDGPAHVQMRRDGDEALFNALVWFTGVPARTSSPAPPDGSSGSGGSPGSGGSSSSSGSAGVLGSGYALAPGDVLDSPSGQYHFTYQGDGNLVLYDASWSAMWASGTSGSSAGVAALQGDGNFVIYDAGGVPVWASGTHDQPGASLAVQDDGNVVIYGAGGSAVWATGTSR